MKDFIKFTFASVLGVVLAGIIFTILGIVTMVGMVASSDTETMVEENSIFVLDLEGTLSERVQDNPFQAMMGEEYQAYGLNDILASIQRPRTMKTSKESIYRQPSWKLPLHHWKKSVMPCRTSRKAESLSWHTLTSIRKRCTTWQV